MSRLRSYYLLLQPLKLRVLIVKRVTYLVMDRFSTANRFLNEGIGFVDSTFFDMFDYPFTAGSHKFLKEKTYKPSV